MTTSNSIEYPLDTIKIADVGNDNTSQSSNTIFTTVTTCCSSTFATTTTTVTTVAASVSTSSANDTAKLVTTDLPMEKHVLEQKIVTETKTSTTTSTISLLPGELPPSSKVIAGQTPNAIATSVPTATGDQSELVQPDQQPVSNAPLTITNEIPQENDLTDVTTITEVQQVYPAIEKENVPIDEKQSTNVQIENETKDQTDDSKLFTSTVVTSSDIQLERLTDTSEPSSSALRKTQSEHGRRLSDDVEEKIPPTADELRDALKEIASTKLPKKRLTEKQREKLSASCGHLHIQSDNKIDRRGKIKSIKKSIIVGSGSIRQSLATARHEPRRKLSSISEKSIEIMNGGNELIAAPSSISCPTTTRQSKGLINADYDNDIIIYDHRLIIPIFERNFNPISKLQQNQVSAMMNYKTDSDRSSGRQRSISIVDARPPWDSSPLKDGYQLVGGLDRIAPLQPSFSHSYQRRKWISSLPFDDEHATGLQSDKRNTSERRQSDWSLHDVPCAYISPASHSARLHIHKPLTKVLRDRSGVKWEPNDAEDSSRPVKEQLWWGAH
uniref:DH domain-containing protein n=1 Tax=Elaeophora elaphi TaxID=1147741 RepID=A0A0R3S1T4_9BILA